MASKGLLIGTVFYPPLSINFNGADEDLYNSTAQTLGIANEWSIQALFEPATLGASEMIIFTARGNPNSIIISIQGGGNAPLRVWTRSSASATIKRYEWESIFTVGVKVNVLCTWNGTDLLMYIDGLNTQPTTKVDDNSGTMTDTAREVSISSKLGEGPTGFFDGKIHSVSVWDTVLDWNQQNVLQNFGSPYTFDNRVNSGDYTASANLVHYWRLGADASDIGKDSGTGTPIDIGDDAGNVTSDDIVIY